MRKKYWKFTLILLIFTMFLVVVPRNSIAKDKANLEIPITITLKGIPVIDGDYQLTMKSDQADHPMPDGSQDGKFTMNFKGEEVAKLPAINYSSTGIYTYTIYQNPGDNKFNLVVYVTSTEDDSGLETTVILYLPGQGEMLEGVEYTNELVEESENLWSYLGLFLSGAATLILLGFAIKKSPDLP